MITLVMIVAFMLVACLAAAGLIASAQNSSVDARAMAGIDIGQDAKV